MRISYDAEVDALYIRFKETTDTTQHIAEGIAIDYGGDGKIAGIEVLEAAKRLGGREIFKRVTIEELPLGAG